jgi:hypothetical protein
MTGKFALFRCKLFFYTDILAQGVGRMATGLIYRLQITLA